jgi:stage V sporulation protein B
MNSLIGAVVKTIFIFVLATRPGLGIMGAALAIMAGIVLVTMLHFATIVKVISFSVYIREYVKAFMSMGICGMVGDFMFKHVLTSASLNVRTLFAIMVTTIVYLFFLLLLKLIKKEEVAHIPMIGPFLSRSLR